MSPKNPKSLISHTISGSSESQFYDVNHEQEPRAVIVFLLLFLSFVPAHRARGGLGVWQVGQGCPAAHHLPARRRPPGASSPHGLGSGPIQHPSCCWMLPAAPVPATLLCPGARGCRPVEGPWPGPDPVGFPCPAAACFRRLALHCVALAGCCRGSAPSPVSSSGGDCEPIWSCVSLRKRSLAQAALARFARS